MTDLVQESYRSRRFRLSDVLAGLTVGLILVPQAMAYADLAGMPPERGLYAAAIPLLVAAPLACSPYLQTGPVAVTALLSFAALNDLAVPGSDEYIALGLGLALVVGLVRLAIGLLHAGVIAYLMSQPMLLGFIPGAAAVIVCSQLPSALGADPPHSDFIEAAWWCVVHPGSWELESVLITVGIVVAVFGGRRLHPLFPGILLAAGGALLFSELSDYSGPVIGNIPSGLPPVSADLPWGDLPDLLLPGVVIAVVGYAEAGSIARTFAAQDRVEWDSDREFVSQGAANVASAFSGGFPVGGSFSRSSLNRMAGGWSRWSGAVTGVVVLGAMVVAGVFEPLPKAVLGAIILCSVIPLIRVDKIWAIWRPSKPAFLIAATTFVATLILSPRVDQGVMVGVGISIAVHLWRELRVDTRIEETGDALHVYPAGVLWFGATQALHDEILRELAASKDLRRLVIHLGDVGRLDITGAIALRSVMDEARSSGMTAEVVDVHERDERLVERVIRADCPPLI